MNLQPDKLKTWAVVVGIDKYGEGFPTLKNQVDSACRITRWMIGRGVQPNRIFLHLSPKPDSPKPDLIDPGVNLGDASENTICDTLNQEIKSREGDLLYIFWGGHGIVAGDDRTLIAANAKVNDVRSIDLNSLLSALRSSSYGFSEQAVFVDACARHFPDEGRINPRGFSQGLKLQTRKQFVLYSAAEAESARDGLFSSVLLDCLESADQSLFVPDLEQTAKDLRIHFSQLRTAGMSHQTPVYFSYKPWEDEEKALIGESRFLSLIPEARAILREVGFSSTEWKSCYRRAFRDDGEGFVEPESPEQSLYHLARPVHPNRIELLLEFVWRIAEKFDREDLRKWVIGRVGFQNKLEDLKLQMREERLEEKKKTAHLLIEVIKDLESDLESLKLQSWFYQREKAVSLTTRQCSDTEKALGEAVCAILEEVEGSHDFDDRDLAIELFVETRLLNCPAEQWEYCHSPLGSKYPFVLRWHERLRESSPKFKHWRRVAKQIHELMEIRAQASIFWVPDEEANRQKLAARCNRHFDRSFLGFTDKNSVDGCLLAALENGVPYAFFPRKEVATNFKSAFTKNVNELNKWDDLPNRMMKMRFESLGDDRHHAASVTLLWDDPRRTPPRVVSLSIEKT